MEKYAVLKIQGKQYKVHEGQEFLVDKLTDENVVYEVLLYKNGGEVKVGKPTLSGVKIGIKVLEMLEKGEKIDVFKYKSKSRFRKHTGFRPKYSRLLVEKLN